VLKSQSLAEADIGIIDPEIKGADDCITNIPDLYQGNVMAHANHHMYSRG
jgi:hypothetical protein